LPATAVAALVMRIVIVIRVVFIFLKIDQTAPLVERYQPFTKSLQLQGNIIFAFYFADAA
jgi:hypothetical protein